MIRRTFLKALGLAAAPSLGVVCPKCGFENHMAANYCADCGGKFADQVVASSKIQIGREAQVYLDIGNGTVRCDGFLKKVDVVRGVIDDAPPGGAQRFSPMPSGTLNLSFVLKRPPQFDRP